MINDRATLMNLLLSTDNYTVGTGIMTSELNNGNIISIPLKTEDKYMLGIIFTESIELSHMAVEFIDILKMILTKFNNI